jgi:hypothetical protein
MSHKLQKLAWPTSAFQNTLLVLVTNLNIPLATDTFCEEQANEQS